MVNEAEYLQLLKLLRLAAKEAIFNREIELAKRHYNKLLKLNPGDYEANHNLALLEVQTGNFQSAIELLRNGINSSPTDFKLWLSYAEIVAKNETQLLKSKFLSDIEKSEISTQQMDELFNLLTNANLNVPTLDPPMKNCLAQLTF